MTATYDCIATTNGTGSSATVTFSNIPQTYTDLILIARPDQPNDGECDMWIRVGNGSVDTGSNYSGTFLNGNGTTAASRTETNVSKWRAEYYGYPATTIGNTNNIIQFMNYSNTTTYKTALIRANSAATGLDAIVQLWASTSAIDTISLNLSTLGFSGTQRNFSANTTFTLYGIKAE